MNQNLRHILDNNIDLAVAHGYTMIKSFALTDKKGCYMSSEDLSCHPLETVVLGQTINGPINVDIANNLGVHPSWVDGFLDGFGNGIYHNAYLKLHYNDPARKRYTEGFEDGHELDSRWPALCYCDDCSLVAS